LVTLITIIAWVILIYFIVLAIGYTFLLVASFRNTYQCFVEAERCNSAILINKNDLVPVTAIMPVYNAENRILNAAFSVLQSEYKNLNFIIVNDGSTDKTFDILEMEFDLYAVPSVVRQKNSTATITGYYKSKLHPNLVVINKEHSGGPDTVQVGLNACRTPLYLSVDSDTVIEPLSITRLIFTFLSFTHTLVVGGAIYILNDCTVDKGKITRIQVPSKLINAHQACEYLRSFIYGRSGWESFGGAMCFPGAFTLYETQAVRDVGGYDVKNYSYDVDIIMKLHNYMRKSKYPYSIHYSPNAFAWCEEPSTFSGYWKQRNHWQRGMLRSITSHINILFNPRFGLVGFFNFPYYIVFEVFGPVIEFLSYVFVLFAWYLGIINGYALILFIILAWSYSAFLTSACILLNAITFNIYRRFSDILNMLSMTVVSMFGFRQFHALCCFASTIQYFFNRLLGRPL
jgi:cellulose synthase/poly-beta-1,6-N-acetylglucosamine synthase-like glycosyltransferase